MKQVLSDRIISIDENFSDNRYSFVLPETLHFSHLIDMGEVLLPHRNDAVEYRRDYKLWNNVYPIEKELSIFEEALSKAIQEGGKIHIASVSLREEIEIVRKIYLGLGYFNAELNRFEPDFQVAPVTIGVNIRNLIYSTKDYKSKRDAICFVPPPREAGHVKSLFAAINAGIVNMIGLNGDAEEEEFLQELVASEKTNLVYLANALHWNYIKRGFQIESEKEWILQI